MQRHREKSSGAVFTDINQLTLVSTPAFLPERLSRACEGCRRVQSDTIVPGCVQGLDRYAYANNNPVRYNDPSGHFTDEQLFELYGEDWFEIITELYSKDVVAILMSDDTQLGDLITFEANGNNYGALLVLNENNQLSTWNVNLNQELSLETLSDNYAVTGLYSNNDGNTFTLSKSLNDNLPSEIRLHSTWRSGNEEYVDISTNIDKETVEASFAFVLSTAALFEGVGWLGIASYAFGAYQFCSVANVDMIYEIQDYSESYPEYLPPPPSPIGTPPAPFSLFP